MTDEERIKKLEYLRKQKDGIVQGGYRDLLVGTYNFLKELCNANPDGWCNPYNNQISLAVYGDTYNIPMVSRFVNDLRKLGYIKISGSGATRKIFIAKEIDF